jgi:hypothetical protein
MPRAKRTRGEYVCPECGRSFKMGAHLARHRSVRHGVASKASMAARAQKGVKKAGRRGRRPGIAGRFALHTLSLEELGQLVQASKAEAQRKLDEYRRALQ